MVNNMKTLRQQVKEDFKFSEELQRELAWRERQIGRKLVKLTKEDVAQEKWGRSDKNWDNWEIHNREK